MNKPEFYVGNLIVSFAFVVVLISALFLSSSSLVGGYAILDLTTESAENVDLVDFEQMTAEIGKNVSWVNHDTQEIIITPAPSVFESDIVQIDEDTNSKIVKVSSDYSYENVLTYSSVPELKPEQVKLYWMIEGVKTDVTEDVSFNVTFYDETGDELIDKISWITPHLSEQEFILEFDITVINPWEFGLVGGNWVVYFNTTGTGTLNITKDSLAYSILEFNSLKCGDTVLSPVIEGPSVKVYNYSCSETASINHTIIMSANGIVFSQRFDFGNDLQNDVDFAYDPAMCLPWDPFNPEYPDCSACSPEGFVGFDIAPPVDGACYSDPMCATPCGGGGPPPNNAPQWSQAISDPTVNEDDPEITIDTDLTAAGNGRCQDGDGDPLTFGIDTDTTTKVDCSISTNKLKATLAANFSGSSTCVVSCSDGTDSATDTVTFTVNAVNDVPEPPSTGINSTDGTNQTGQNLNCYATITDRADGDSLNVTVKWFKNNVTQITDWKNNSIANGTFFNHTLGSGNTSADEKWKCEMRMYDGNTYSTPVNSSELLIASTSCYNSGDLGVSSDTSCSTEKLTISGAVNITSTNTLNIKGGWMHAKKLDVVTGGTLNITDSNVTFNSTGRILGNIILNNATLNLSVSQTRFQSGSFVNITGSTLYTKNATIHAPFVIDPSNWTNIGNLSINNTVNITDTILNVTHEFKILENATFNATNSTIYTNITRINGSNVTVDPSTWIEEGDLIVGPGAIMDYIDTGVIVAGKVLVDGGTLNFLTNSVLQMNKDNQPATGSEIKVRDLDGMDGLLYIDSTSKIERNSTTDYDFTVYDGGSFTLEKNVSHVNDFTANSGNPTLTLNSGVVEVRGDTTLDVGSGTWSRGTSTWVSNGTGTLSLAGSKHFYNLNVSTGTTTLGAATIVNNRLVVVNGGTLDTSNNALTTNETDLDGTLTAGSSTIIMNGNWNSSGGTFTQGTSTLTFAVDSTLFTDADEVIHDLTVNSGKNVNQSTNVTINGTLTPTGGYHVRENSTLFMNWTRKYGNGDSFNLTINNGTVKSLNVNGTNISILDAVNINLLAFNNSGSYADSGFTNISSYLNITSAGSNSVARVNISYIDSEIGDVSESTIKFYRYSGSWSAISGSSSETANNHVFGIFTSFSPFVAGGTQKSVAIAISNTLSNTGLIWDILTLPLTKHNATGNNGSSTSEYLVNVITTETTANLTINASGALTSGGNTIAVGNIKYKYSATNASVPGTTLTDMATTRASIGNSLSNNTNTSLKFFLTVPSSQSAGNYTNTIEIRGVAS